MHGLVSRGPASNRRPRSYQERALPAELPRRTRAMRVSSPTWARTRDRSINSRVLCQLSYRGSAPCGAVHDRGIGPRFGISSGCSRHQARRRAQRRPEPPWRAPPGSRTPNLRILNPAPLPVGLEGHVAMSRRAKLVSSRATSGTRQATVAESGGLEPPRAFTCPNPFREGRRQAETRLGSPCVLTRRGALPRFAPSGLIRRAGWSERRDSNSRHHFGRVRSWATR